MKLVAAVALIIMQGLGLTAHVSNNFRSRLTNPWRSGQTVNQGLPVSPTYRALSLPIRTGNTPLSLEAGSAISVDAQSMQVLYAKDSGLRRPIASITKLATALIVMRSHDPAETVIIPKLPTYASDDAIMGLRGGETFRLGDLIKAMLIQSADDAADSLAIWDAGTITAFTDKMNAMMEYWKIADTHFSNASGLVDRDNYATAASLARLSQLALSNTTIRQAVTQPAAVIANTSGKVYGVQSTNDLLANSAYHGIKTGYTVAAGGCFVGLVTINGHDVITVVLGSANRFAETKLMTSWIGNNWQWQ